ncbi:low molecular weight protein-tyrosine-phosphatase [Phycisphaera mikurensis]|uniref:Low molecular weight protein-tyrosine-phosphatase n=1 Tax=Phycisphaera mikurensis (strain NBRC 102666 / KCTC 22515 / FYK2301M01) TaxID=1142394 RepID=I0IHJ8_PHYMF|nr:low molecular weight protein-tyrosine-phosphatase [Phycisphaera mikurensis]MBB6440981.1 protein-tyrosine phosphatase [Phycisphaera mikurensis]BAM04736.1 low molecular weight protein-tyrosine-phosphatase [Phycisphaera mikurensis NBRC 102666]
MQPRSVLFVCLGNICRSPAAEGVLRRLLAERGLQDAVEVDSAGLLDFHAGEPADARMRKAARRRGMSLTSVARTLTGSDLRRFDLIVAMDASNLERLLDVAAETGSDAFAAGRLRMLGSFLPDADRSRPEIEQVEVPDPYYGDGDGFAAVLDLLEAAMPGVLETLLAMPERHG